MRSRSVFYPRVNHNRIGNSANSAGKPTTRLYNSANLAGKTTNRIYKSANLTGKTTNRIYNSANSDGKTKNRIYKSANLTGKTKNRLYNPANSTGKTKNRLYNSANSTGKKPNCPFTGYQVQSQCLSTARTSRQSVHRRGRRVTISILVPGPVDWPKSNSSSDWVSAKLNMLF